MNILALLGLLLAWAVQTPAWAQAATAAAASTPADHASAADAAMERARRQAANPLRIILEASKARRRPVEAEVGEVSEPTTPRGPVARSATPSGTGAAAETIAVRQAGVPRVPATAATAPTEPEPVVAPVPTPSAPIETRITLSSSALQARGDAAPVPDLANVVPSTSQLALPAPSAALLAPAPAAPRLLTMVEPVLPARALADAGGVRELPVDLLIRTDGSVATATVATPAPRPLVRAVVAALEQWRFEPLAAERIHRVQLVFGDGAR